MKTQKTQMAAVGQGGAVAMAAAGSSGFTGGSADEEAEDVAEQIRGWR